MCLSTCTFISETKHFRAHVYTNFCLFLILESATKFKVQLRKHPVQGVLFEKMQLCSKMGLLNTLYKQEVQNKKNHLPKNIFHKFLYIVSHITGQEISFRTPCTYYACLLLLSSSITM